MQQHNAVTAVMTLSCSCWVTWLWENNRFVAFWKLRGLCT